MLLTVLVAPVLRRRGDVQEVEHVGSVCAGVGHQRWGQRMREPIELNDIKSGLVHGREPVMGGCVLDNAGAK